MKKTNTYLEFYILLNITQIQSDWKQLTLLQAYFYSGISFIYLVYYHYFLARQNRQILYTRKKHKMENSAKLSTREN